MSFRGSWDQVAGRGTAGLVEKLTIRQDWESGPGDWIGALTSRINSTPPICGEISHPLRSGVLRKPVVVVDGIHNAAEVRHSVPTDNRTGIGEMTANYDLVIRGGTIVDGNGGAPFVGDILVLGEYIDQLNAQLEQLHQSGISAKQRADQRKSIEEARARAVDPYAVLDVALRDALKQRADALVRLRINNRDLVQELTSR